MSHLVRTLKHGIIDIETVSKVISGPSSVTLTVPDKGTIALYGEDAGRITAALAFAARRPARTKSPGRWTEHDDRVTTHHRRGE